MTTELLDWTLDRTADFARTQRSSIGRRIDDLTVQAVELTIEARYASREETRPRLQSLNLIWEKLRVFWRLAQRKNWLTPEQLVFVTGKIDEAGRYTGAWLKKL